MSQVLLLQPILNCANLLSLKTAIKNQK